MKKRTLRENMITKLKALPINERKAIEEQLRSNLLNSSLWKNSNTIGITISKGFEWDTQLIIEEGWRQGKSIVVPKCFPNDKELVFYRLHSFNELESVYYNLLEPKPNDQNKTTKEQIDLLLVPGIVYDERGYRIGFGGGYYDRFLFDYNSQTVSLLSTMQLSDNVPVEPHDIPVQHLLTENGFIQ
ncbi:5-formyltetrahydrofolate cyclo-ligase [Ornithinibacillus xuwenensis]|uniref:5-formyltetrahydrofolate cyclo-ligase n=1 Tax=Ornithinibacillus xuwenensis TaxID=3144668 RepID=A0ABU9XCI1_9BACI